MKTGFEFIQEERQRQVSQEGWTPQHDDHHTNGELRIAGQCYVMRGINASSEAPAGWPWEMKWWKPSDDEVRNLTKGGALFLAESERLMRLGKSGAADVVIVSYVEKAAQEIDLLNQRDSKYLKL